MIYFPLLLYSEGKILIIIKKMKLNPLSFSFEHSFTTHRPNHSDHAQLALPIPLSVFAATRR